MENDSESFLLHFVNISLEDYIALEPYNEIIAQSKIYPISMGEVLLLSDVFLIFGLYI